MERCWGVPIRRNSVLEGLSERKFEESQLWIDVRVFERVERAEEESEAGKERYS